MMKILLLGCHYRARVMFSWQTLGSRDTRSWQQSRSGDTTLGMAAKDITERRIMLWTSYVRPVMFQPWLIQTPTWHHDTHSSGDRTSQSEAQSVGPGQWEATANKKGVMCDATADSRHSEQRKLFSEYWWWLFTRQFIQTHFRHKIL